jgi:FkbM family methyltransferase
MTPYFLNKFSDDINGVIHVGAHLGQEVEDYNNYNLKKILLFEPQQNIFNQLLLNTEGLDNVKCFNFGLGSVNEKKTIYKSIENDGKSSSVLQPELHLSVQPNIKFDESEEIEIKRFDTLNIDALDLLTIDVQGLELEVIKGFGSKLSSVKYIFSEINTKYLYKNNALVSDIDSYLCEFGFERIYTNLDPFKYYGDALYIQKKNKNYKKNILKQQTNKIIISNLYLNFKKIFYPKKLLKTII